MSTPPKPPKEMDVDDFKYFLVVEDVMVAGVYEEDDDNIYAVFLKGMIAPNGTVTSNTKENIADQIDEGIAFVVDSYSEAITYDNSNAISPEDLGLRD